MKKIVLFSFSLIYGISYAQDPITTNVKRGQRRANAQIARKTAALQRAQAPLAVQNINGDETLYADKRGSFGKALAQLATGFINVDAFNQLVTAINNPTQANFNAITMGTDPIQRRLVDPQAAFAFNLDGPDGWLPSMPAAPALASAETAGEMVELYWHALLRDIPFNEYDTNATAQTTIASLNSLSDFKGPKIGGAVTAQSLFRGNTPGDLIGPFVSQFLYQPIPYGPATNYDGSGSLSTAYQAQVVPAAGTTNDFMTNFTTWSAVQKGINPTTTISFISTRTFIRNERDLGDYVHQDTPQQAYLNAALILLGYGSNALDPANPYLSNPTQEAFVTYNVPDILYLVSVAAEIALRAAWYQKWVVHRRTRPEFVGFLVQQEKTGAIDPFLNSDLINSNVLTSIFSTYGSYFLPQAYPEGSPTHPSYPAGHATVAGCCVTILKAFFNEEFLIPSPVEPDATNTSLVAYTDTALKVGNELNKLGANIALGRDMAGVHYRSDGIEGMLLGEQVALALLQDESFTRFIPFTGFSVTTFEGTKITIGAKQTAPGLPQ